jgi:hypothetical protein
LQQELELEPEPGQEPGQEQGQEPGQEPGQGQRKLVSALARGRLQRQESKHHNP